MSQKQRVETAIYLAFFALIMCAPLVLDPFWLNRIAKYLVFGMLGIAVALSWGYAGILNLGQGLFFGAGAYMLAMSLKLASPTSLQQGSDKPVPDFMLWNAEPGSPTELCCRWRLPRSSEPSCFASASRACSFPSLRSRWCCWCVSW